MVSQTGHREVRSNFCKRTNLSWKRAKQKFWGQKVWFGTKLLKFGPKKATWQPCLFPDFSQQHFKSKHFPRSTFVYPNRRLISN